MPEGLRLQLRRSHKVFLLLIACLVGVFWWYQYSLTQQAITDEVGTDATAALVTDEGAYTTFAGESFDFTALRGQPRVVTLWASWSPFSRSDINVLSQLASEDAYAEIAFVLLNRSEPVTRAEDYLSQFEIPNEVFVVIDTDDTFFSATDGFAMPETIVFSAQGEIQHRIRGTIKEAELRAILDDLSE